MVKSILNTYEYILKILALHKYSDPHLKCQRLKKKLYQIIKRDKERKRGGGRNQAIREFVKRQTLDKNQAKGGS